MNPAAKRLSTLQSAIKKNEAHLFEDPIDLFYLTGKELSLGTLIVLKDSAFLLIDGRYFFACKTLLHVTPKPSETHSISSVLQENNITEISVDPQKTTIERYDNLTKTCLGITINKEASPLKKQRWIKDATEIAVMKENAKELYACFEELLLEIEEGISEYELASCWKILALKKGASGFSFEPIIAFGENSAFIHHRSTDRKLKKGDIILIDSGLQKNHYQSDATRSVFFGAVSQELMHLHDVVLASHDAALQVCKEGVPLKELDLAARAVMKEAGLEEHFMHSLGHGIGLETHEGFRIKHDGVDKDILLQKGMVLTIEPGLYLEGKGGIRYEDTIVITEGGYDNFFPDKKVQTL